MKTMTHTSTKTAVAWMIVGGVAALVASMAIGLPWDRTRLDNQVINTGKTNGDIDNSKIITHKSVQCYYMFKGVETTKTMKIETTGIITEEYLINKCRNTFKGTQYVIINDDGTKSDPVKL